MSRHFFRPLLAGARFRHRLIACAGAALCLALTMLACAQLPLAASDLPVIVAPLGASAVLVFAVPASPLAQPWPVIGGNTIATLVGVAVFQAMPNIMLAAGIAVGAAILAMSLTRCLHPPGGAAALTAVIGSGGIHAAGYAFAIAPVAINSIALVLLSMLFHRATGHSYPHAPGVSPVALATTRAAAGFHADDIDRALADMPDGYDIDRADLDLLLSRAELHARQRLGGERAGAASM